MKNIWRQVPSDRLKSSNLYATNISSNVHIIANDFFESKNNLVKAILNIFQNAKWELNYPLVWDSSTWIRCSLKIWDGAAWLEYK